MRWAQVKARRKATRARLEDIECSSTASWASHVRRRWSVHIVRYAPVCLYAYSNCVLHPCSHGYETPIAQRCPHVHSKAWVLCLITCSPMHSIDFASFSAGRPLAHPNYGFRRQLAIFAENGYFRGWKPPVRTHPAYATWQKKKKKDVTRYLSRVDGIIEFELNDVEDARLSLTEYVSSLCCI